VGLLVRKRPCSCGSGRPRHDCCGWLHRVDQGHAASAYLARQARPARDLVGPFSTAALTSLQAEAAELAHRCPQFAAALLRAGDRVAGDVRRVARARALDRGPGAGSLFRDAVRRADTPMARVAVARALVAVREAGLADEHVVAAAVLELAAGPSPITEIAVCAAAAELAGRSRAVGPIQVRSPAPA
jgi:hypothetical protein